MILPLLLLLLKKGWTRGCLILGMHLACNNVSLFVDRSFGNLTIYMYLILCSQVDMSHKHQVENRCALFVVFPKEPSTKYVAFVFEFQGNLRISICDVNTNEMVHSIQTDIPALEFHMEKGGSTNHGVLYR